MNRGYKDSFGLSYNEGDRRRGRESSSASKRIISSFRVAMH